MTNPMRVLQLLPSLDSGGVEKGTLEIAKALVEAGHHSYVASTGGRLVEALVENGSTHISMKIGDKSLLSLIGIFQLRKFLRENKIDIVHARSRLPAWLMKLTLILIPKRNKPRFITTCHGAHSVNFYSSVMGRSEKVIAVSNFIKDYLVDNYNTDEQLITVIHRGVSETEFPFGFTPSEDWLRKWRETYPALKGKKILCLPGRLTRLKGHIDFIDLINKVQSSQGNVVGLIVGAEDPKRKNYANDIYQLAKKSSAQIIFTGHRDDIKEIYAISDIVYSLSNKPESFGRTVLEPLCLGKQTLGYAHGGASEILDALYPQGKVNPGDIDELTTKTIHLLNNPEAPSNHGAKIFSLEKMLSQTLSLYKSLIA